MAPIRLSEGLNELQKDVTDCVRSRFAHEMDVQQTKEEYFRRICTSKLTPEEAMEMLAPIRAELEHGITTASGDGAGVNAPRTSLLRSYLLREQGRAHGIIAEGDQLHKLLLAARSAFESDAFRITLTDLLDTSFSLVASHFHRVVAGSTPDVAASFTRVKLLARFKHVATATLSTFDPFAGLLLNVQSLEDFCWMIYSED